VSLREPAWRVTTRELELAVEEERGEGERAASYVLSPFGARMNRVVVAGAISGSEAIGRQEPGSFWRSRLTDALGEVAVTAGAFQPRAMVQLRSAPVGRPAIVVGKAHLYRLRDGRASVSVRAEAVRPVGEADERAVVAETVRQTLDRLDLMDRLEHEPSVEDPALRAAGCPAGWIRAARASLHRYPNVDRGAFRSSLRAAVHRVAGVGTARPPPPTAGSVTVTFDPPKLGPTPPTAAEATEAQTFLGLVDDAAASSDDGYADVRDVLRRLADRGIDTVRAEAVLGRLEEGGVLEEPVVGKLRRA
jgi:uncharacterized protein